MFYGLLVIPSKSSCNRGSTEKGSPEWFYVEIDVIVTICDCHSDEAGILNDDPNLVRIEMKHTNGDKMVFDSLSDNGLAEANCKFILRKGQHISCTCSVLGSDVDEFQIKTLFFSHASPEMQNGGTFKWQVPVNFCVSY